MDKYFVMDRLFVSRTDHYFKVKKLVSRAKLSVITRPFKKIKMKQLVYQLVKLDLEGIFFPKKNNSESVLG